MKGLKNKKLQDEWQNGKTNLSLISNYIKCKQINYLIKSDRLAKQIKYKIQLYTIYKW
jgi:hypothetical protein